MKLILVQDHYAVELKGEIVGLIVRVNHPPGWAYINIAGEAKALNPNDLSLQSAIQSANQFVRNA